MNASTIEIINGRYLRPDLQWQEFKSIKISDGRILSIDKSDTDFKAERIIDAKNCFVAPGLVDLCASLGQPGSNSGGTIQTETKAAAAGGITHLCCTPDSNPINDSKAVTKLIHEQAKEDSYCQVLPIGALTKQLEGSHLSNHSALKSSGCVALSNAALPLQDLLITQRCLEYATTQELPVFLTPIEPSLYRGCMHEGQVSTSIGLEAIPDTAETIAVAQLIQLAEQTGARLHLSRLSSAGSVELLANAKQKGLLVTADVAIANLLFTDHHVKDFDSLFHCHPPLRSESDRQALLGALANGTIDAICSAHCPVEEAAKLMPFAETAPGMSTLESIIPAILKLAGQAEIDLATALNALGTRAANVLGIAGHVLEEGNAANLFVTNPDASWKMTGSGLLSKGKNAPFINQNVKGKVIATIWNGKLAYTAH